MVKNMLLAKNTGSFSFDWLYALRSAVQRFKTTKFADFFVGKLEGLFGTKSSPMDPKKICTSLITSYKGIYQKSPNGD